MKKLISLILLINGCMLAFVVNSNSKMDELVHSNFEFAQKQYSKMLTLLGDSQEHPYTIDNDGSLRLVPAEKWTSGFFPGCLWLTYEYTNDPKWKTAAQRFTSNVESEKFNDRTHDMGFKMYCSFGNGYRLTGDQHYRDVLLQSARTLITRFNSKVGCIRSWDHHEDVWQFPVIIDNMMNLELLFWATRESGDSTFYRVAITHANTTMKNQFRADNSTWHVLNYDTTTGTILARDTHQGYSQDSCWARGQAWGFYGFVLCYRETGDERYLSQAQKMIDYVLNNKNLSDDLIPYWDFDAPNIPNEERDVSAGAIICSALYELDAFLPAKGYRKFADKLLEQLSSNKYRANNGENDGFILMHGVANKPSNSGVDKPLIYADYYFLEANLRRQNGL